jgi:hypothetical protein
MLQSDLKVRVFGFREGRQKQSNMLTKRLLFYGSLNLPAFYPLLDSITPGISTIRTQMD